MATHAEAQAELCRLRRDIARIEGHLAEADRLVLDSPLAAGCESEARDELSPSRAVGSPSKLPGGPHPASTSLRPEKKAMRHAALSGGEAGKAGWKPREKRGRLRLDASALDEILGGGLPLATLHEIRTGQSRDGAAAAAFILALLCRLSEAGGAPAAVWISEAGSRREAGGLYPPGLLALGLDPSRIVEVAARTQEEALWAFEAALACRGLGAAICEMRQASLDLTATRRCALRAREAGVTGFLLRLGSEAEPSAAELRFRLAPAPAGTLGRFDEGVGRMAWQLALEKNRGGRTGSFTLEWNAYERSFIERAAGREAQPGTKRGGPGHAHPQPLPAAPPDRPPSPDEGGRAGGAVTGGRWRRAS